MSCSFGDLSTYQCKSSPESFFPAAPKRGFGFPAGKLWLVSMPKQKLPMATQTSPSHYNTQCGQHLAANLLKALLTILQAVPRTFNSVSLNSGTQTVLNGEQNNPDTKFPGVSGTWRSKADALICPRAYWLRFLHGRLVNPRAILTWGGQFRCGLISFHRLLRSTVNVQFLCIDFWTLIFVIFVGLDHACRSPGVFLNHETSTFYLFPLAWRSFYAYFCSVFWPHFGRLVNKINC